MWPQQLLVSLDGPVEDADPDELRTVTLMADTPATVFRCEWHAPTARLAVRKGARSRWWRSSPTWTFRGSTMKIEDGTRPILDKPADATRIRCSKLLHSAKLPALPSLSRNSLPVPFHGNTASSNCFCFFTLKIPYCHEGFITAASIRLFNKHIRPRTGHFFRSPSGVRSGWRRRLRSGRFGWRAIRARYKSPR